MIKVSKKINLEQLDKELNGLGLIASINEAKEIIEIGLAENNPATEAELKAAIDAHNAQPETQPTVIEKLASVGLSIDDLKAALGLQNNLYRLCLAQE